MRIEPRLKSAGTKNKAVPIRLQAIAVDALKAKPDGYRIIRKADAGH